MTSKVDPVRSRTMRAVKSKDTRAELQVRSLVHRLGYRFRLYRKDIPGTPDLAFLSRRKVIFVQGCFWHGHQCKRGNRLPKSNRAYWKTKITRNVERDLKNLTALEKTGWKAMLLWECELVDPLLEKRIMEFLDR
jgi:DNA mismatch endonuclease (patch repair protein)